METRSADVAIVGAGLIGSSIAWRLAQQGVRVRLFDSGALGGEASSAGAGMLSPGGEFDRPSPWLDLGIQSLRLYPAFVEELRSETGLPIDFRICGCLALSTNDKERSQAKRRAKFQSSVGIRAEQSERGLFYPDAGLVDPTHLVRALRCALEARGGLILEHHAVPEIEAAEYAAVVIAAGAWSGRIQVRCRNQPLALPGTTPVKGHLIGFDFEPDTLGPMLRHGHTYVLQRSNGFTIAGSTEERIGFDRAIDPDICADIQRRAAGLFPALERATPSKQWIGFRPYSTAGGGPHIGRVRDTNVWLAYGHYRNGILLAPVTARRVADSIVASFKT